MSIVRIGLAETKKFAEGYEAIFGKQAAEGQDEAAGAKKAGAKSKAAEKKAAAKKSAKKK